MKSFSDNITIAETTEHLEVRLRVIEDILGMQQLKNKRIYLSLKLLAVTVVLLAVAHLAIML